MVMTSFLIRRKTKKSYMEAIATLAYSSRASYRSVLNRLEECCNEKYNGRSADDIVEELRSIDDEQRDDAYCGVLQDYVNWLTNRNLSHNTVKNHFAVVVHYFSYHGIRAPLRSGLPPQLGTGLSNQGRSLQTPEQV